jgi:hypothetical protein
MGLWKPLAGRFGGKVEGREKCGHPVWSRILLFLAKTPKCDLVRPRPKIKGWAARLTSGAKALFHFQRLNGTNEFVPFPNLLVAEAYPQARIPSPNPAEW